MATPRRKDFGQYTDPLADPRGPNYSAIAGMDTDTADDAANKQAAKDYIRGAEADRSGTISPLRVTFLLVFLIFIVPLLFVVHPIAGIIGVVLLIVAVLQDFLRRK